MSDCRASEDSKKKKETSRLIRGTDTPAEEREEERLTAQE
jgi:hypothetical protein